MPSIQTKEYTYLAHTFGDSTSEGIYWSEFKVTAHTADPTEFYTSVVGTGYSVDNIAPMAPSGLIASVTQPNAINLAWDEPVDEDFSYFRVYRSEEANFDPTAIEPIAELAEFDFSDTELVAGTSYYYKITAVDANGNESDYSPEVSATALSIVDGMLVPEQYALHQNYPNPFNPTSTIGFDLPAATDLELEVYDLRGRLIARLSKGSVQAGYHPR